MKTKQGFSLIEVLVGAAIISAGLVAIMGAYGFFISVENKTTDLTRASFLLEGGIEGVRFLRDSSWTTNIANKSTTTVYYMTYSTTTNKLALATTSVPSHGFVRTIRFYDVFRDANKDIATSGTFDINTKKVAVSVSWVSGGATTSKNLSAYITNIYGN